MVDKQECIDVAKEATKDFHQHCRELLNKDFEVLDRRLDRIESFNNDLQHSYINPFKGYLVRLSGLESWCEGHEAKGHIYADGIKADVMEIITRLETTESRHTKVAEKAFEKLEVEMSDMRDAVGNVVQEVAKIETSFYTVKNAIYIVGGLITILSSFICLGLWIAVKGSS